MKRTRLSAKLGLSSATTCLVLFYRLNRTAQWLRFQVFAVNQFPGREMDVEVLEEASKAERMDLIEVAIADEVVGGRVLKAAFPWEIGGGAKGYLRVPEEGDREAGEDGKARKPKETYCRSEQRCRKLYPNVNYHSTNSFHIGSARRVL